MLNKESILAKEIKAEGKNFKLRDEAKAEKMAKSFEDDQREKAKKSLTAEKDYLRNPGVDTYNEKITADKELEASTKKLNEIKAALSTGDIYNNLPSETSALIRNDGEIDLAGIYGVKYDFDSKAERIPVENYHDDTTVGPVEEGSTIPSGDITDYISIIDTEKAIQKNAGILITPETMLEDDTETLNNAVDSVQEKHMVNTETMLLCRAVKESKTPTTLTIDTFSSIVNGALCAKAKRGAEIITNEDGFDKLDVADANGNPLLKRDFVIDEFVFMDKYIVRTVSNNILENYEDGSDPVFVGDWRNVLRLAIIRKYPPLIKEDLMNCTVENRAIKKVIPILTTTADDAFIVGSMA